MLVLNAGDLPGRRKIAALPLAEWDRVMRVNLDANLPLLRLAHPFLKLAPAGGRVVVIGSKNVPAPGPGAAGLLGLEGGARPARSRRRPRMGRDGIRVNVAPSQRRLRHRHLDRRGAALDAPPAYGLTVEEYSSNNVLRRRGHQPRRGRAGRRALRPLFAKTTGAQIPIDGGNERVI